MPRPVIFCFDGSDGSKSAMVTAADLVIEKAEAVVLTVWEPVDVLLARTGSVSAASDPSEEQDDARQQQIASTTAQTGAQAARGHGFDAVARVESADQGVARRIIEIADRLDARLLVCGQHGRRLIGRALLGSVSHDLIARAHRPVLVAPERAA